MKMRTPVHVCGECALGEWSRRYINLDVNGKPFVKECEYSNWAINKYGKHVCLATTAACSRFQPEIV